eukprot:Gb_25462 [translate_table: standard]
MESSLYLGQKVVQDCTVLAFVDMMQKKITMPTHLMYDGQDCDLFNHYSCVAQRLGVYTARDYANILEFFVKRWNVEKLGGLSSEGRKAQECLRNGTPNQKAGKASSRYVERRAIMSFQLDI